MNNYLNFLIEANVGLCFFIVLYLVLLSRETDFRFKRLTLIAGLMASLIFPLIHLNGATTLVPSISNMVPVYWLPEVVVGNTNAVPEKLSFNIWFYIALIYGSGVIVFLSLFLMRLLSMMRLIRQSDAYRDGRFIITESTSSLPTFSFFNFIFIGRKDQINEAEKQQIIEHEKVHGRRLHSFDILLLNILQIFFWFNPLLGVYKKIFIQLHEFEADARAVENRDVNDYCSLLARVALLSADFKLANHFNNSLTLKRINMMRTIKRKIRPWKMAAFFALVPVIFIAISCQDQIAEDIDSIVKNSAATTNAPEYIQKRLQQLRAEHPEVNYLLFQMGNGPSEETFKRLEQKYGLPKSMEVFTGDGESITGASEAGVKIESQKQHDETYIIMAYHEIKKYESFVNADGNVFTVVEKMPEYIGGQEALGAYLSENIKYPKSAFDAGISGTVFMQFIVNADGKISDASILKGVNDDLNNEAMRVVESMPAWVPGEQQGKRVKVKYVLPIKFAK